MRTINITLILPIVGLLGLFASCSPNNPPSTTESSIVSGNILQLSARMGSSIVLTHADSGRIQIPTFLSGRIAFDPNHVTRVYPLVTGIINRIYVNQGEAVHKGQVLADVYSPEIATSVSDEQKARANLAVADKSLERMKYLLQSKLVSSSDLEQAESAASQAHAEYDRSLHALRILGATDTITSSIFQITAPIDGTVIERAAEPGSQVRNDGTTLAFTIGSTSNLWISLQAYPNDLKNVHVADSVVLKAAGFEDHPSSTRIDYISPTVDTTFTTQVRCSLPNMEGTLKPGMFVSATAYHPDGQGLFVPSAALFYDADGKTYVFVQTGQHRFRKQQVTAIETQSDRVQITSGLTGGEPIAGNQALFLNDELQADQK